MTLEEKTAGSFSGNSTVAGSAAESHTFSDVLEKACEKLMDKQVKNSIRRIEEMEEFLCGMEKELDDFLCMKNREAG